MLLIRSSVKLLISLIGETISLEVQKLLSCMAENKVWRRPYVNWRRGGGGGDYFSQTKHFIRQANIERQ